MNALFLIVRLVLGAWLLFMGLNHFVFGLGLPSAVQDPFAAQLLEAFAHSGMLNVAMVMQLVAGVLLLAGLFVPLALCVVTPVLACTVYWAVVLEGNPLLALLSLTALLLAGLLMLGHLDSYRGMLRLSSMTACERPGAGGNFDETYARPIGTISPANFALALVPLAAAAALYHFYVPSLLASYCLMPLGISALILLARLLQGLGRPA